MSQLRTNSVAAGTFNLLAAQNDNIQPSWYSWVWWFEPVDTLWPRSQLRTAGLTVAEAWLNSAPRMWDWSFYQIKPIHGQRRNVVTGVTRDATGAILSSCTVKLYETASDVVMDTGVVSDPTTGVYVATSPNSTNCYAVAYKAGSLDKAGTTVNTLTPT